VVEKSVVILHGYPKYAHRHLSLSPSDMPNFKIDSHHKWKLLSSYCFFAIF